MSSVPPGNTDSETEVLRMTRKFVRALKRLEGFDPNLDLPLIEEAARSAVLIKRGERYLNHPECTPETYSSISDAIAKHASRMRQAMKELAATRAERIRHKSATALMAEFKQALDKVIRQED